MPREVNKYLNTKDYCGEFDYALKFMLNRMLNTKDYSINGKEFKKENMLIGYPKYRSKTITIVDNHDTDYLTTIFGTISKLRKGIPGNEINFYNILLAYFIILMLPGTPMIHKLHYDVFREVDREQGINNFILLRSECCIVPTSDFEITKNEFNDIAWVISGIDTRVVPRPNVYRQLLDSKPSKDSKVLCEVNEKEPTESNAYSVKFLTNNLWAKVSFI